MPYPNFFIVGAMKSGTTSLYHYLKQHPQIFLSPIKEPHYFAYRDDPPPATGPGDKHFLKIICSDRESYLAQFSDVSDEIAIGDASAMYLYYPEVPQRIKESVPDAKIIIVLRNPIDRAYSSFLQLTRDGREPYDNFEEALSAENQRIEDGWLPIWHYVNAGRYAEQIARYQSIFDPSQLRIYLFRELRNTNELLEDIFDFLGVKPYTSINTSARYNVSGIPQNKSLHRIYLMLENAHALRSLGRHIIPEKQRQQLNAALVDLTLTRSLSKPKMDPSVREMLREVYRDDIFELEALIKRDLSAWLQ